MHKNGRRHRLRLRRCTYAYPSIGAGPAGSEQRADRSLGCRPNWGRPLISATSGPRCHGSRQHRHIVTAEPIARCRASETCQSLPPEPSARKIVPVTLRPDETLHRLRSWTAGQALSERLAAQVLSASGYTEVDPIHPLGGPDGGRDAEAMRTGQRWAMAVWFPRHVQSSSALRAKFRHDVAGAGKRDAAGIAFVTNQSIPDRVREELREIAAPLQTDLFHVERLVCVLDGPDMHPVRRQYLSIDYSSASNSKDGSSEAELLESQRREMVMRREQRLVAAGVDRDHAQSLAVKLDWSRQSPLIPEGFSSPMLLCADAGRGKTEVAHEWFLAALANSISDAAAPHALWLDARVCSADLTDEAVGRVGGFVLSTVGLRLVVDGLDEVPLRRARELLLSAERLAARWPRAEILATARPEEALERFPHVEVPALSIREGWELAEKVAERPIPWTLTTLELSEALRVPLFAISIGSRLRVGQPLPESRRELLESITDAALASAGVRRSRDLMDALQSLAVRCLEEGGSVSVGDMTQEELDLVLATRLVTQAVGGRVLFTLATHAQRFAVRAIENGTVPLERVASGDQFPAWRWALAANVSTTTAAKADSVLRTVTRTNAGAGSWLLDQVSRQDESRFRADEAVAAARRDGLAEDLARLAGPLRDAYESWFVGLGDAADAIPGTQPDGQPAGWDVGVTEQGDLFLAERSMPGGPRLETVTGPPDHVFRIQVRPEWSQARVGTVATGPLDRWRTTREFLQQRLESALRSFGLATEPGGILERERVWQLAQIVNHGHPHMGHPPIEVSALREKVAAKLAMEQQYGSNLTYGWGRGTYTPDDLRWLLETIQGHDWLERPGPSPDRLGSGGGHVSSIYSAPRYLELTRHVVSSALEAYIDLVNRNFAPLGHSLGTMAAFPLKIAGQLNLLGDDGRALGCSLNYTVIPTNSGGALFDVDIDLVTKRTGIGQRLERLDREMRDADIARAPFFRPSSRGTALWIEDARPVTEWAYQWLIEDLHAIGLLKRRWTTHR
jgi:hypothetical protein